MSFAPAAMMFPSGNVSSLLHERHHLHALDTGAVASAAAVTATAENVMHDTPSATLPDVEQDARVRDVLNAIPMYMQSAAYVSLVSHGMFKAMSEMSAHSMDTRVDTTHHGHVDLSVHRIPQHATRDIPRMFSRATAAAHGVSYGVIDAQVVVKVLPPSHATTPASAATPGEQAGAHTEALHRPTQGRVMDVHCSVPIRYQRSVSDPMHPYIHAALTAP
jgi:hypothetical protein